MSHHNTSSSSVPGKAVQHGSLPSRHEVGMLVACSGWFAALFVALALLPDPLPDFSGLDAPERKDAFFDYLDPIVTDINDRVRAERAFVREIIAKRNAGTELSWLERLGIDALAKQYEVVDDDAIDADAHVDAVLETLNRRIGVIPSSLALIQAAKESGWGTSRFATEGNNLFGQRCYERGCGIAPRGRPANAGFGLARFGSVEESVASYARNLNTHPKYEAFRELRAMLRAGNEAVRGLDLAQGLLSYSERGQIYVEEIKSMIRQNGLE